mmetsp:Transcript_18461/g.23774  ORF Transcript_18461/g.23774 Transcript_18461/m.23774 type:complete len:211 (-) Transcript_18461:602-1234(-)
MRAFTHQLRLFNIRILDARSQSRHADAESGQTLNCVISMVGVALDCPNFFQDFVHKVRKGTNVEKTFDINCFSFSCDLEYLSNNDKATISKIGTSSSPKGCHAKVILLNSMLWRFLTCEFQHSVQQSFLRGSIRVQDTSGNRLCSRPTTLVGVGHMHERLERQLLGIVTLSGEHTPCDFESFNNTVIVLLAYFVSLVKLVYVPRRTHDGF